MNENPTNAVGGDAIAGAGTNEPVAKTANTSTEVVERKQFAGVEVFVVDAATFSACRLAKTRSERFSKHVGTGPVGLAIQEYGRNNPGKGIMIECGSTGTITYLRIPRGRSGVQF